MIRELTTDDWKVFRQIRLEALTQEPGAFAITADEFAVLQEPALRGILANKITYVAFDGDEPVGMMSLVPQHLSKKHHRSTLIFVYLRAAARGRGLSKALHAAIVESARKAGLRQIELQVTAENTQAIEFYDRLGYQKVGRIPGGFLHDGREIDEIVMALRI